MKTTPTKNQAKKSRLFIRALIITGAVALGGYLMFFYPRQNEPPGFHAQREMDFYDKYGRSSTGRNCTVVEIDGCEYIEFQTAVGYFGLTHKGNCKNPIHYK